MWVKICGINDRETAAGVAGLGPDAIGLNFYEKSPRCVSVEAARQIVHELPGDIEPVGVFVNRAAESVAELCREVGLRAAQIHGDESPAQLSELRSLAPELKIVRGHRMGSEGVGTLAEYLAQCRRLGVELTACLVDARAEGVYGGSGHLAPWNVLSDQYARDEWPPLVLAGGLHPENVAEAIKAVDPWGVDVASGVESSAAIKDLQRVEQFIRRAREASA